MIKIVLLRYWYTECIQYPISRHTQIPVVPHKAVAEVSQIGNLSEKSGAVAQKWQSEPTDGLKGGCVFSSDGTMAHASTAAADDSCPLLLGPSCRDTARQTRRRDGQHFFMFFCTIVTVGYTIAC